MGPWVMNLWVMGKEGKAALYGKVKTRQTRAATTQLTWQHRSAQNRARKKRRKIRDLPSGSKAKPLHMLFTNVSRHKVMVKGKGLCMLLRSWVSNNGMGRVLFLINKGKSALILLKSKGKRECVSLYTMGKDKS